MTDFNDGTIHGWNGGDCPVHPETVVRFWLKDNAALNNVAPAKELTWVHKGEPWDIIAFRVVKQHDEPKVIWVNEYEAGRAWIAHETENEAKDGAGSFVTRIAVKYVEAIADAKERKE